MPFHSCGEWLDNARRLFEARQFGDASQEFTRALASCPQRDSIAVSLGQTQFLAGDESAAEQTLRGAIQSNPNNNAARYALGRIFYEQGRYPDAVSQLEGVVAKEPENYRAHDNLALCYDMLQQDANALRHFFKALDLVKTAHREYDWVYANLAEFFLKRDQFDKAFPLAVEAAERNPNSARDFFLAGQALVKLGQFENSLKWLRRATELDRDHAEAHYQLAQALRRLGKTEESKAELEAFRQIKARVSSKSGLQRQP